jgi:8-oxo-dGTP pyrophosphatase MutT (NUDIX family)
MPIAMRCSAADGTAPSHSGLSRHVSEHRITQYGAIAWRPAAAGVEVLLITSRETRRWVVPRGNVIKGLAPHMSAAQEAYEEAGIRGRMGTEPIGLYHYQKKLRLGRVVPAEVHLYPLEVTDELDEWPERHQRERRWFAPGEAAASVEEPELKALILALGEKSG